MVRGTFSPSRRWRPAVVARLARTLGLTERVYFFTSFQVNLQQTMPSSTLSPAIPQLPSGNLQVTAEFYRERLGFTDFEFYAEHGHLIATRGPVEIHFWDAGSEDEARKYGSASSCYIRVQNIDPLYEEF